MGRILGIDFGTKRIGVAVTDPLKIIASPLDTVANPQFFQFLENYLNTENVEKIVVGMPVKLDNTDTDATSDTRSFITRLSVFLKKSHPGIEVITVDERYTSSIAFQTMIDSGIGKKKRRDKNLIDKISASLILQSYLGK